MKSILNLFLFVFVILSPIAAQKEVVYSESLNEINEYILSGEYSEALPLLLNLEKNGFKNGNVEYKIGYCYLNTGGSEERAIPYLQRASKDISPDYQDNNLGEKQAPLRSWLALGDAYRINNQFDEAKKTYHQYLAKLDPNDEGLSFVANKKIGECVYAKAFMKKPIQAKFVNLGQSVNNGLANFDGCISGDGKTLVFIRKMKFYDAIFTCKRESNSWSIPEEITTKLGSDGEFYPTALSYDGTHMLLNSYGFLSGNDIYESTQVNGKWTKVKKLEFQVSTKYNDIDAIYSPDGKEIFFASNRENGLGGYDIYKSKRDELGNWSFVENLGTPVNSAFDERSPSIFNDGKVLVYSSTAEPNMGGYDFFYALKDSSSNKYTKTYNVGYPINTSGDDLGIKMRNKPGEGVMARHSTDNFTDEDLYWVQFADFSKFHLIPISGIVTVNHEQVKSLQNYRLAVLDENIKDTVEVMPLAENGSFNIDLYPGDFMLNIKGAKVEQNQVLTVPENVINDRLIVVANIVINETETTDQQVVAISKVDTLYLTDILFDFNKFKIPSKEINKLAGLIAKLKQYPISRITIIGYADNLGSKAYNDNLSKERALEVKQYLQNQGISKDILFQQGAGGNNFVAINTNADGTDNPEGRAYNRRVELKIVTSSAKLVLVHKNIVPLNLQVKH